MGTARKKSQQLGQTAGEGWAGVGRWGGSWEATPKISWRVSSEVSLLHYVCCVCACVRAPVDMLIPGATSGRMKAPSVLLCSSSVRTSDSDTCVRYQIRTFPAFTRSPDTTRWSSLHVCSHSEVTTRSLPRRSGV